MFDIAFAVNKLSMPKRGMVEIQTSMQSFKENREIIRLQVF